MLDRLIQKAVACVPPDWQPAAGIALRILALPLRCTGWIGREMWLQLRGRAQNPVAPFLWPAFIVGLLVALYSTMESRQFAELFHSLTVPLFIALGLSLFSIGNFFFGPKRRRRR